MSFDILIPDDLLKKLSNVLSRVDEIAPKMLEEAAPIVQAEIARLAPYPELASAIAHSKPQKTNLGWICSISVKGKKTANSGYASSHEVLMSDFAAWVEYGHATSNKDKIKVVAARPFLVPGITNSKSKASEKMREVFERETEIK